jgi:opacity protein-like surface antigen
MKRITSLAATTAAAACLGLAALAVAPAASADTSQPYAFAYTGYNYSGSAYSLWRGGNNAIYAGVALHSAINHTDRDAFVYVLGGSSYQVRKGTSASSISLGGPSGNYYFTW